MNKIAYLKPFIGNTAIEHAYVRETPNGKIIGSINKGEWVQLPGAPNRHTDTTEWTEIWFPARELRGWMATKLLDIHKDPQFDTGETVHERQERYKESVSFPKREPEILDTAKRGAFRWFDLFVALVPAVIVLGVLYGCVGK